MLMTQTMWKSDILFSWDYVTTAKQPTDLCISMYGSIFTEFYKFHTIHKH